MKYEINRENLQGAYLKLKNYIFYYNSSSYLKKKMLAFEKQWSDQKSFDRTFDSLVEKINSYKAMAPNQRLSGGRGPKLILYPKKDKISVIGVNGILIEETNLFIDAEIWIYLIDILFVLNIYERVPERFDKRFMFGTVFDSCFESSDKKEKTPCLFENHSSNYENWKNKPFNDIRKSDFDKAFLIKFDLRRCFYNFNFDIKAFIKEVFGRDSNNYLCELEAEIHNYYTRVLKSNYLKEAEKERNISILPIGLLSSSVILNYYLSSLDDEMGNKCISYGRYTDDFLILYEYGEHLAENMDKKDFLCKVFGEFFVRRDKGLFLKWKKGKLPLNEDKLTISIVSKSNIEGFRKKLETLALPSFVERDERKIESPCDAEVMKIASMRNWLYDHSTSEEEKVSFFSELNDAELINAYPIWRHILPLDSNNIIRERIGNGIKRITIKRDDGFLKTFNESDFKRTLANIKKTLEDEFEVAKRCCVKQNEYKKHLLIDIEQEEIFSYLRSYKNTRYKCFPIVATKQDIMFYLQTEGGMVPSEELLSRTDYLYNSINFFSDRSERIFEIEKIDDRLTKVVKNSWSLEPDIRVAVVNLQIDASDNETIIAYDLDNDYPNNLSYSDICNLIDSASRKKVSYILLPEFSVLFDKALDIISLCFRKKISLVAGLTHYCFKKGSTEYAYNCTLIYSYPLRKPFIHKKRYLPEEERQILEGRGIIGLDSKNNYLLIHDGSLFYSVMTCFEATNIVDRAAFKNRDLDAVFLPVYNRDTAYFSAIVDSFSRDISSYIIQSNVNEYGDSRITGPLNTLNKDLVKLKGGLNHFYVIGKLSFDERNKRLQYESDLNDARKDLGSKTYFEDIKSIIDDKGNSEFIGKCKWKPSSADERNQIVDDEDGPIHLKKRKDY